MAVIAVALTLAVLFVPLASDYDSDAVVGDTYSYTISKTGTVSGMEPVGTSGDTLTSVDNANSGSWTWDEDGYGPFNSFYAAFDPARNNCMICHLDPDDLTRSVDGESIAGKGYNIMWCLPTVYWLMDSDGDLILTNDPDSGGEAYAHTIYGEDGQKHVYNFIGIGVYEASKQTVGGQTILTSFTDSTPTASQSRDTFRDQANNQLVNTDGKELNGYAMLWNFYQWQLWKFCTLAVMGSWDSRGMIGQGVTSSTERYHITGELDTSGPYAGYKNSWSNSAKAFIENAWGGVWDFVDGIVIINRSGYYIDQKAVPNNATSANGTSVKSIAQDLPRTGPGSFSSTTHPELWGMPTTSGSSSTNLYGGTTGNGRTPSTNNFYAGGDRNTYNDGGMSCIFYAQSLSYSYANIGARLAFVFDADPESCNFVTYDHSPLTNAGGDASSLTTETIVPCDEPLVLPDLGTVDGYTHGGWLINGVFYDIGDAYNTTSDITIQSLWYVPTVTITMMVDDSVYATLSVPKGSSSVVFTPENVSGVFRGWFYDPDFESEYNPLIPLNENVILYAKGVYPLIFTTDPVADGEVKAIEGQPGTISFRATDSQDYTSALWDFGDGTVSNDLYSTHYYSQPGTYTATLTVFNNFGSDTTEFIIEVPEIGAGGGGNDLLLVFAAVLAIAVAGGLVVRRFL